MDTADTSPAAREPGSGAVSLLGVRKVFGDTVAVDHLDLDIGEGELFAMLGPSGSGKTTVLRMIAGFEQPTAGRVMLGGRDATGAPPYKRDVNTVFQDYALFPHLNVAANVEYSLKVRGVPAAERKRRVGEALEMVRLGDRGRHGPDQLSGGQRQRVALARALVGRPKVLLLDEPLGALDLKLREQMQVELKEIQRAVGITFVFVTHDQDEALTLCDRLAVFNAGRIEQVGPAREVYENPANAFVAGFVGTSNLLTADSARTLLGRDGAFALRPEKVRLVAGHEEGGHEGAVSEVVYAGASTRLLVDVGAAVLTVTVLNTDPAAAAVRRGDRVRVAWSGDAIHELSA